MKTVIVTGGAGAGIGGGIVTATAEAGWRVVIVDKDRERGEAMASQLTQEGCNVAYFHANVADDGCAEKAMDFAVKRFGGVDALVNSAGVGLVKDITEVTDEEYQRVFKVNVNAVFRFCRAAVPVMPPTGGAIVNIGSVHALATNGGYTVYASTKGAIDAFTRALAVDCGRRSIRVNCIHPGLVHSPQNRVLIEQFSDDADAWMESYTSKKQLLPALPTARQIGELVVFFLSDAASAITGQSIAVDGGSSAMLYER